MSLAPAGVEKNINTATWLRTNYSNEPAESKRKQPKL